MLSTNFPGDYYGNDVAKSYDMFGYFDNMRQRDEAFQNQELNRQGFLQDMLFNEQANPYKLRGMQTKEEADRAKLEEALFTNRKNAREEADVNAIPPELRQKAAMSKLMTSMSEDEWKQTEAGIKKMLVDPSPDVRKMGEYLYGMLPDMQKLRAQGASRLEIEQAKAEARREDAERARVAREAAGTKKRDFLSNLDKVKSALDKYNMLRAELAATPKDSPLYDDYLARLEALAPYAQAEAQQKANKAAVPQLPGLDAGIPAIPSFESPKKGAPTPGSSKDNPIVLK